MDPLSATLSLISLATTLAEILQLALKLRESFQKISRNKEEAKRLASEVVATLQQLKDFYSDHSDILENSISMKAAIVHLNSEIQGVYSKCCTLTPIAGAMKGAHWKKARTVFISWKNRGKVEEDVKELKAQIMLCYMQFTTFATARVEASTRRIHDISTRIEDTTTKIENRFLCLTQSQITRVSSAQISHLDVSGVESQSLNLLGAGFAGTLYQPAGMDIADTYLCSEIATIDQSLKSLSRTPILPAQRAGPYNKHFQLIIHIKPAPGDLGIHRRDVIMKTLAIFHTLHNSPTRDFVFQKAGWDLINLSIGLHQIQHCNEAIITGLWAVRLFRNLANVDPNVYNPYLALSLHNLSHYYLAKNNKKEALDAITECVKINRALVSKNESSPEILGLLVRSLVSSAKIFSEIQDHRRSLEEIEEAVKISEDILLGLSRCQPSDISVGSCLFAILSPDREGISGWSPSPGLFEGELRDFLVPTLQGHAQALHQLSYNLHHCGRFVEAIAADTKALQILRWINLGAAAPILEDDIAEILCHLTHSDFQLFLPTSTSMVYIEESISIYRRASANGSIIYSKLLYHALYTRATILRTLERYLEEVDEWNKMIGLARSIQEDLLLANALYQMAWAFRSSNQFKDAAASRMECVNAYRSALKGPSQLEANAHYELAIDLDLAGLYEQARNSAQESVNQYRDLALKDHNLSTEALADSLALLADISLRLSDVGCALGTGKEALNIYQASISRDPDPYPEIISKYMHCLDINTAAAFSSEDKEQAIERGTLVVDLYEGLTIHKTDAVAWGIIGSWECLGHLFNKYNRLSEARLWAEKAVEWYTTYPIVDADQTGRFMSTLCNYGAILDAQGLREQALDQIVASVHLGKDFAFNSGPYFASIYCTCIVQQVDLLLDLGRYLDALDISKALVVYIREEKLPDIDVMVDSLLIHATAINYNQQHEEAINVSKEAIEMSRTNSPTSDVRQMSEDQACTLAQAFHTLSESLADCGRECEALVCAQKAVDHIHKFQFHPSHPRLEYKRALFTTNLCARLAASGNYQESIKLLEGVKTFYENNARNRNGFFIEFARSLRLLGLLYCTWGKHDDGIAISISLTNIRERLLEVAPDQARYVNIYLKHEIRRPSWLGGLQSKLDCSHQPDVSVFS